jgi:hypothetical protein
MKNKFKEEISESELKIFNESRELFESKNKIHELLKKFIIRTELGEIEEGYADDLNFDIGKYSIYSCGYYQQLMIVDENGEEHELDNNLQAVRELYARLIGLEKEFNRVIENKGLKIANKVFKKHLKIKFGEDFSE